MPRLFDDFLWSVNADLKVVISDALAFHAPELVAFADKQLFPVVSDDCPKPSMWAWHFKEYSSKRLGRHERNDAKPYSCQRCGQRYKKDKQRVNHEVKCQAVGIRVRE